jgi:beta-lactamase regulating signal transducer with metallopeptidase domain/multidrug efflux pump subunit AcrA (membrane-fusion protein)
MTMSLLLRAYPGDFTVQAALTVFIATTLIAGAALAIAAFFRRRPAVAHCLLVWALIWILIAPVVTVTAAASGYTLFSIPIESRDLAAAPQAAREPSTTAPVSDLSRSAARVEKPKTPALEPTTVPIAANHRSVDTQAAAVVARDTASREAPAVAYPTRGNSSPVPNQDRQSRSAATALLAVWFAGTILMFGALARSLVRMRGIRRSLVALDPESLFSGEPIRTLLDEVRRRVGVAELPTIGLSSRVSMPCVLGIFSPAVALPENCLREVSGEQFADVLVHECAHVVRRDCLVVLLQRLASTVFWINPLVLLLNRSLTRVREEVCDNYVLAGTDPVSYGETLLRFAELARGARAIAVSAGILHWRGRLERRIAGLVDERRSPQTRAGYRMALLALATFGCLCLAVCDVSFSSSQPSPPPNALAKPDSTSIFAARPPKTVALQQSDSEPRRPSNRGDVNSRFGRPRRSPALTAQPNYSGIDLVKDRPHTLSISEAQRARLYFRVDGVDQFAIAEKPKRMPPLVENGSTLLPPNSRVRLRTFPPPGGCRVEQVARISVPGPLKGVVTSRGIRVGDHVKKGELLVTLYSGDVANTMNDLVDATAQLKLDEAILKRTESPEPATPPSVLRLTAERNVLADKNAMTRALRTLRGWDIPDSQIHQAVAEAAKVDAAGGSRELLQTKEWGRLELRSPIDGVVLERNISDGEAIVDNTVSFFTVANLDTLFVTCTVREEKLPALLASGPNPTWVIRTKRGDVYNGTIATIDPKDSWVELRGPVDNSRGLLRGAGERVTVTIPLAVPPDVVEVPDNCIFNDGQQDMVFVQKDPSKPEYTLQRVVVADRLANSVLVRSKPIPKDDSTTEEHEWMLPKEPLSPGSRLLRSHNGQGFLILKSFLQPEPGGAFK